MKYLNEFVARTEHEFISKTNILSLCGTSLDISEQQASTEKNELITVSQEALKYVC